ncbi:MAG TPA: hypothetical protein VFB60_12155 [Ktedonobacteraceae bacterium]|nr:hypothetical protein [Ktedonobacteraceae bacterium]
MTGQPVAPRCIVGGALPIPPIRNGMHHVGPEAVGVRGWAWVGWGLALTLLAGLPG